MEVWSTTCQSNNYSMIYNILFLGYVSTDKMKMRIVVITPTFILHKSMTKLLSQKINLLSLNLNLLT